MNRLLIFFLLVTGGCSILKNGREHAFTGNPVLPGDFADPYIIVHKDTFYIYATTGREATVWKSADFQNWKLTKLNWPTSMHKPDIWAPAVARGTDGRFYLYTSTDHNIYAGVADHPTGPFTNILGGDSIFIKNRQWWNKMHSIDADCFVDDDGQAYLYWGSGFEFKDGICAVGILNSDMASFKEQPKLITPPGYFEGPHMMKRNGLYYLMYSDGLYYDSSYKVRYAVSKSPLGPFTEGRNSPVLKSSPENGISGPGHHSTLKMGKDYYIVYHRHAQPIYAPYWGPVRQVCIDKMEFEKDGSIKPIKATWEGVPHFVRNKRSLQPLKPVLASSNSALSDTFDAPKAFDRSYGTLWAASRQSLPAVLTADFADPVSIGSISPVFDQVMGAYRFKIEYSKDGAEWLPYGDGQNADVPEWPLTISKNVMARYVRLTILSGSAEPNRVGLWELNIYPAN
jgi:beta-xylosidase